MHHVSMYHILVSFKCPMYTTLYTINCTHRTEYKPHDVPIYSFVSILVCKMTFGSVGIRFTVIKIILTIFVADKFCDFIISM